MEEKKISIRTGLPLGQEIPLCPHISIFGTHEGGNDNPEYEINVPVKCNHCNQVFVYEIRIN